MGLCLGKSTLPGGYKIHDLVTSQRRMFIGDEVIEAGTPGRVVPRKEGKRGLAVVFAGTKYQLEVEVDEISAPTRFKIGHDVFCWPAVGETMTSDDHEVLAGTRGKVVEFGGQRDLVVVFDGSPLVKWDLSVTQIHSKAEFEFLNNVGMWDVRPVLRELLSYSVEESVTFEPDLEYPTETEVSHSVHEVTVDQEEWSSVALSESMSPSIVSIPEKGGPHKHRRLASPGVLETTGLVSAILLLGFCAARIYRRWTKPQVKNNEDSLM